MKKILLFSAFISLFVSCNTYEYVFDEDANKRIETIWNETEAILNAAENGWSMEFYYGYDLGYGGYQMFMKFDNGTVEIASEDFGVDASDTSYYSYAHDVSATINFDTYNDVLHYYSTPSSSNTTGLGGDYEFVIIDYSPLKVTLRGKRTYITYVLTPLDEGKSWEELMKSYTTIVAEMSRLTSYTFVVDGESFDTEIDSDRTTSNRRLYYTDDSGEVVYMPFVYTFTGIKFYYPVTFGGLSFSEMVWTGTQFVNYETGATLK